MRSPRAAYRRTRWANADGGCSPARFVVAEPLVQRRECLRVINPAYWMAAFVHPPCISPKIRGLKGIRSFSNSRVIPDLAIEVWLALSADGRVPKSTGIRWLTWRESANRFKLSLTVDKRASEVGFCSQGPGE